MREFWDKVLYYREHIDELPVPKPKEKRPRKKKEEKPVVCEIMEMSEDECLSD
jgi:hypothetical protein